MIVLYTLLLVLLAVMLFVFRRRASGLEKKFVRISKQADELIRQPYRCGNTNRADACESAKRQYHLALLANKRDRVERLYNRWQDRADRTSKWLAGVRRWKGRKLPYTFGVLDVVGLMALIDFCGAGRYVSIRPLFDAVAHWIRH
jgi:hypothetical protein